MLYFRKLLVANFLWIRERGGVYQDFPSKIFCLTLPKNFVGEPISVSLFSGIDNLYTSEG